MKRIPTEIKKQRGTLRADRLNPNEPILPTSIPPVPSWLTDDGKQSFIELSELLADDMAVLTKADTMALTLLCDAYGEYLKAKKVINELGPTQTVTSREGNSKEVARPEVMLADKSFSKVFQMLKEFGLTPVSRAKVNAIENSGSTDVKIENFFNGGE